MGTEGDDLAFGSVFSDTYSALGGNDIVFGQEEGDSLLGQEGNDQINGNRGNDTVSGGLGDDSLRGGRDADSVLGDAGNDTVFGDRGSDTVRGGEGRDVIYGGKENDDVAGGEENDFVSGDIGDDTVAGDGGNDTLLGQDGNDIISGGAGLDVIRGGEGTDSISGNEDNDSLSGNQGNDTLDGGTGDDVLSGGKDNDLLLGDAGADTLNGERGNDTLDGGEANDVLSGGKGNDSIDGGQGDDLLIGGRGDDTLTGGEGEDSFVIVDFEEPDNLYTVTDFSTTEDILSLEGGLRFEDLEISDEGGNTVIRNADGNTLAILIGVDSGTLNSGNFFPTPETPFPTATPTPTPTPTDSPDPTPTPTPTDSPDPSPTPTDSPDPSPTPTDSPDPSPTPTDSPDPSPTPTPTDSPDSTPSPTPTDSPDSTPSPTPPDPGEVTPPSLNDPPTDILLDNDSVEENSEAGTVIGTFTTEDPDESDVHEYRLVDDADGRFALNEDQLVVAEGANLDFEQQETYDIQVRTFDNAGENLTKSFTIALLNVNDPPEITIPDDQQLVNEGEQLDIVGIEVTDPDAGDGELEVTLETTNDGNLTLNSTSGLTFTTGDGQADAEIVFTGSLENINQSLNTLTYTGNNSGSDSISISVNDQGNTGLGEPQTDTALINLSINDLPLVGTNTELVVNTQETGIIDNTLLETTDDSKTSLIYTVTEFPTRGNLLVDGGSFTSFTQEDIDQGLLTYEHDNNDTKNDSFSFSVSDQVGGETTDTFEIRVNVPPNITSKNLSLDEDTQEEITNKNLLAEDPDTDAVAETLIYEVTELPTSGKLQLGKAILEVTDTFTQEDIDQGSLSYQHTGDEPGTDTFSYVVTDQDGGTTSGLLNININPGDTSPIAGDDVFETNEDTAITINKSELLANDSEADGEQITITEFAADNIKNGTLAETTESFIYTPNENFSGEESFTYTITDTQGFTDTATVNINVTPVADTPNLEISTPNVSGTDIEELPLGIAASLVDTSGSENLSITISGVPAGATLSAGTDQGDGSWVLTPEELTNLTISPPGDRETGTTFSFDLTVTATATETANDATATQTGTISVQVEALNDAPVLTDLGNLALTTINENEVNNTGTPVASMIAGAVTDADGGASSGIAITQIDNSNGLWQYSVDDGTNWVDVSNSNTTLLTATTSERLRFVPNTDFFGDATIQFRGWDTTDGSSNTSELTDISTIGGTNAFSEGVGTANILVNDIPEITKNSELVVNLGGTGSISQNLLQTTDGDNGTNAFTYTVTTEAAAGILQLEDNPTNTFTQENINSGVVIYQHTATDTNDDSFSFQVIDVDGGKVTDTFNIRVNDPPVGTTTDLSAFIGQSKVIPTENLQFIDPDVETATAASLQYTLTEVPTLGELQQGGETLAVGSKFTQENLDNGEISYATTTASIGTDSFNFLVTDQDGGTTSGLLNINIVEANRPPEVEADKTVILEEDNNATLDIPAPTDPDGDALTITVDSIPNPEIGQVLLSNDTPVTAVTIGQQLTTDQLTSLTFVPVANANGAASTFSYTVDDGNDENSSSTQVINIDVTPVNDLPIAIDDGPVFTNLGNVITIDVLGNDSDIDGPDPLSITTLSNDEPLGILNNLGTQVQYTAVFGTGTDLFQYTITDGLDEATATATVNILDVSNDPDFLVGGEFNDNFDGSGGDDTLEGLAGNDTLAGDDENDSLVGGDGNDSIDGGDDDDIFIGGLGADTLSDDNGNNTFVYTSADDGGAKFNAADAASIGTAISAGLYDRITGFEDLGVVGGDTIAFSSTVIPAVDNIATDVQTTNISGNVLIAGNPGLFAYEVEGKTYLIYDANGDNTVGDDSQILAELEDVSGVVALDINDDFTII
ncbi:MAG: tandem-95 repeat protein [Okeania sp. SIO2C2]|uniref:cadherin-like domain-containing protein n=1 Tax=Okeania sp. SIO2C2 TaxID=2607787 RepID=UPI0013BD62E3|nr:cadherin-like domain-containing protein [Okeania sp. SIO2C2]NEP88670.1 tandem-95 repeat protein [Okeania sp. SIO2C2]